MLPWLLASVALAEEPDLSAEDDFVPNEVIVVQDVRQAREELHEELVDIGYRYNFRKGDRTIYRHRDRWRPEIVVDDEGWVLMRDSATVLDATMISPAGVGVVGRAVSPRKQEHWREDTMQEIAPQIRSWQSAMRNSGDLEQATAPFHADEIQTYRQHLMTKILAKLLGVDPRVLQPRPPPTRGDVGCSEGDQLAALFDAGLLRSDLLTALGVIPRWRFVHEAHKLRAGFATPLPGIHNPVVPSALSVAQALSVAKVRPDQRVFVGTTLYEGAVAAALGAGVTVMLEGEMIPLARRLLADLELEIELVDRDDLLRGIGAFDVALVDEDSGAFPAATRLVEVDPTTLHLTVEDHTTRVVAWANVPSNGPTSRDLRDLLSSPTMRLPPCGTASETSTAQELWSQPGMPMPSADDQDRWHRPGAF